MATKLLLKRWNGTSYEAIHPKTETDQVIGLSTALAAKVDTADVGAANGVASLDGNSKIPFAQLPSTAITGMDFYGTITTQADFDAAFDTAGISEGSEEEYALNGVYAIVSGDVSGDLTLDVSGRSNPDVYFKQSDGGFEGTITVQAGDWIVAAGFNDPLSYVFAVIDNNQKDRYVSKGGDTMSGNLKMDGNNITNVGTLSTDTLSFGVDADLEFSTTLTDLAWSNNTGTHRVWHEGNDGDGSGLDADKLDGQDGSYYRNASNINAGTINDARLPGTISSDITGNAATATKLATARTIGVDGDVTATSESFDGTSNITLSIAVNDDSHDHTGTTVSVEGFAGEFLNWSQFNTLDQIFPQIDDAIATRNRTVLGTTEPTDNLEGDVWFDTNN